MKQRLLLSGVVFVVLLGVFLIYWQATKTRATDEGGPPVPEAAQATSQPAAGAEAVPGSNLYVESRDEAGRLRQRYQAAKSERLPDGSYKLTDPQIEIYDFDGSSTTINASSGTIYADQGATGLNVNRAMLEGGVRIVTDLTSRLGPTESGARNLVTVSVDNIEFDRELLTLSTDGQVRVESSIADLTGRGLTLAWNEKPAELRLLHLKQGEKLVVHEAPENLAVSLAQPRRTAAPATPTGPAGPAATAAAPPAATQAQTDVRNQYVVEFLAGEGQSFDVDAGPQKVLGLERLAMTFEWDKSFSRHRKKTAATGPGAAAGVKAPQPSGGVRAGPTRSLTIAWSGPLEIRPIGYTATPSAENYTAGGAGKTVELIEPNLQVTCQRFFFDNSNGSGWLESDGADVAIDMKDGQNIRCRRVAIEQTAWQQGHAEESLVKLSGPGRMEQGGGQGQAGRVTWDGEAAVRLQERSGAPNQLGGSMIARQASFAGNVQMSRPQDQTNIKCQSLDVAMDVLNGKIEPTRATAAGSVTASRADGSVAADQLDLTFELPTEATETSRAEPAILKAQGNVRVVGAGRGRADANVEGDSLEADLRSRQATVAGLPAAISQGPNRLRGARVELAEASESVRVIGSGDLTFLSDRDLNSRKLAQPRQTIVNWSDGMTYDGKAGTASLTGGVALTSGQETMTCQRMDLDFASPQTDPTEVTKPSKKQADHMGLSMADYSSKSIQRIVASGDVTLSSVRDGENETLRRIQLKGNQLQYEPPAQKANVVGAGTLLVEDYRPPVATDSQRERIEQPSQTVFTWADSMELSNAGDQPEATLSGKVHVLHRSGMDVSVDLKNRPWWPQVKSGRQFDLTAQTMLAQFDKAEPAGPKERAEGLPVGAMSLFNAGGGVTMTLQSSQAGQPAGDTRQLTGQSVIFSRKEGFATLTGAKRQPAQMAVENPHTGLSQVTESSEIRLLFNDAGDVVEVRTAGGVHGVGRR